MLGFICWYVCVFFNNTQTRIIGPTTTNGRVMHTPVLFCFVCFFVCLFVCVFVLTCESILRGEGNAHTCREKFSWSGSAGRRSPQARRKTTTKLLQFSINFNSFLQCFQRQTSPEATTFVSAFKPGRSTSDIRHLAFEILGFSQRRPGVAQLPDRDVLLVCLSQLAVTQNYCRAKQINWFN